MRQWKERRLPSRLLSFEPSRKSLKPHRRIMTARARPAIGATSGRNSRTSYKNEKIRALQLAVCR